MTKESFTSKKMNGLKKSSKVAGVGSNSYEKRSVSKGATAATTRPELQKKSQHQRMKSNSYRMSNKDSSLVMSHY